MFHFIPKRFEIYSYLGLSENWNVNFELFSFLSLLSQEIYHLLTSYQRSLFAKKNYIYTGARVYKPSSTRYELIGSCNATF